MGLDHIFLDLGLTSTDKDGEITAIAAVRTDSRAKVIASFSDEVRNSTCIRGDGNAPPGFVEVIDNMLAVICAPNFIKEYVIIGAHHETDRAFIKAAWKGIDLKRWTNNGHRIEPFYGHRRIDILQLAWPLCYNKTLNDGSFECLCHHFEVPNKDPGSTMGDCEALVRCYWKLMNRYKTALYGEGLVREIGGKGYESLVSFFK